MIGYSARSLPDLPVFMLVIFGGLEFCNPQNVERICAHRVSKNPPPLVSGLEGATTQPTFLLPESLASQPPGAESQAPRTRQSGVRELAPQRSRHSSGRKGAKHFCF